MTRNLISSRLDNTRCPTSTLLRICKKQSSPAAFTTTNFPWGPNGDDATRRFRPSARSLECPPLQHRQRLAFSKSFHLLIVPFRIPSFRLSRLLLLQAAATPRLSITFQFFPNHTSLSNSKFPLIRSTIFLSRRLPLEPHPQPPPRARSFAFPLTPCLYSVSTANALLELTRHTASLSGPPLLASMATELLHPYLKMPGASSRWEDRVTTHLHHRSGARSAE